MLFRCVHRNAIANVKLLPYFLQHVHRYGSARNGPEGKNVILIFWLVLVYSGRHSGPACEPAARGAGASAVTRCRVPNRPQTDIPDEVPHILNMRTAQG